MSCGMIDWDAFSWRLAGFGLRVGGYQSSTEDEERPFSLQFCIPIFLCALLFLRKRT